METMLYMSKQYKGMCNVCGKIGHKGPDCWKRQTNESKRKGPTNRAKNVNELNQTTENATDATRPVISETKNEGSYVNPNRKNEAPGANNYLQLIAMSLERPLLLCVQYV